MFGDRREAGVYLRIKTKAEWNEASLPSIYLSLDCSDEEDEEGVTDLMQLTRSLLFGIGDRH